MKTTVLLLPLLFLASSHALNVCYYGSWAVYRPGAGKFDVEDIDPFLCSHIIYTFAGLGYDNKIRSLDPWNDLEDDYGKGAFKRFTGLKKKNPSLKTSLAIGGWNEGSVKYSNMASSAATRKIFVDSVLPFLNQYGFDGLDFDWEYPADRGGVPADKENYVLLLKELAASLHPEGKLLTMAMPAGKPRIDGGFNLPEISATVDFMHVMAYDLHGSWENFMHHHTLLYKYPEDTGVNAQLNVDWVVQYLLAGGCDPKKMALGTATYGRCFSMQNAEEHGIYDASRGPGMAGPYTREKGMRGFNEICEEMMTEDDHIVNEPAMDEPYFWYQPVNNLWCGYDSVESVAFKGALAKNYSLAGVMTWSLETDDFHGTCGYGKNPIITSAYSGFNDGEVPTRPSTTTTTRDPNAPSTTTTTSTTTTLAPSDECKQEGVNANKEDCTMFYDCAVDNGEWIEYPINCPSGLLFNSDINACDSKQHVCQTNCESCPNDCSECPQG